MSKKELLGDKVEKVLKKVGGDKAAKVYEKVTKKPCGCQKRKEKLNNFHRKQIAKAKNARARKNQPNPKSG